jgi:hypothetical protein
VFCIICALLIVIAIGWPVAVCVERGWSLLEVCLAFCALAADVCGCLIGVIGCLPWDWYPGLHDGCEHSQDEKFHEEILRAWAPAAFVLEGGATEFQVPKSAQSASAGHKLVPDVADATLN